MKLLLGLVLVLASGAVGASKQECRKLGDFAESAHILAQQSASESVYLHEIGKRIAAEKASPATPTQDNIKRRHAIATDVWNSRKTATPSQTRLMTTLICEYASDDIQVVNGRFAATCGVVAMIGATAIPDKTTVAYKNIKMASDKYFDYAEGAIGEAETYRIASEVKDEIFEALKSGDMTVENDYRRLCTEKQ